MSDKSANQPQTEDPLAYLFTKTVKCPVCEKEFIDFAVRKSKLRAINTDTDYRTHYKDIDPNHYEVLLCSFCGYAALDSSFSRITSRQQDMVKEKITPNHKPVEYPVPYSPQDVLTRFKKALECANAIDAKLSQKAVICLKTAWVYRDMGDQKNETLFLRGAYKGFSDAYTTENFPMAGMDEHTAKYMMAELARRVGLTEDALRLISDVVVARGIRGGLKERALALKEMIRESESDEVKTENVM